MNLDEMHDDYMLLMDKLDTINAQLLVYEAEARAKFWRRILSFFAGTLIVGIVLGLLSQLWM